MRYETLAEIAQHRASAQGSKTAFTWLAEGEREEKSLTYGALDARARAIAAALRMRPGERALLLYPPGLDFIEGFFGCLYAGVVAVPAYPPDPTRLARTLPRLQAIAKDAQATVVLTTAALAQMATFLFAQAPELGQLRWVATDEAPASDWPIPSLDGEALAFLQYTSGSTGTPKGVMLSHGNLVHNETMIQHAFETNEESVVVGWLPQYHDMGLIGNVLQPLWAGGSCVLMSPLDFLSQPMRWLRAVSKYRATTSGGPNFAYDLCVRKSTPEERATVDLSSWRVAFSGAEPVRADTMERFVEAFGPAGFSMEHFYPVYGLAESSLLVSGGRHAEAPIVATLSPSKLAAGLAEDSSTGQRFVGCGRALLDEEIVVVADGRECPEGRIGEIWVKSLSVARGYFGRPELSADTFGARLEDGNGPFLRTGDLGFLRAGELFVSGRKKDLIIIRGKNVYPQDVELTVEQSHPALRPGCGAAFSVERDGEERLVIVQEVDRRAKPAQLDDAITTIREAVAEAHGAQVDAVVLLPAGAIAKTTSGKVQRHASKAQYLANELTPLRAWESGAAEAPVIAAAIDARVSELGAIVAQTLGLEAIDPKRSLASYGVDSLGAVELQGALRAKLGKEVPLGALVEGGSLEKLAALVAQSPAVVAAVPRTTDRPLSVGQRALLVADEVEGGGGAAYHIALALRLERAADAGPIERALRRVVAHHEALRATLDEEGMRWNVHAEAPAGWWRVERVATDELNARAAVIARERFVLRRESPVRAVLLEGDETVLVLVLHHVASDLWSMAVLARQLGEAVTAERTGVPLHWPPSTLEIAPDQAEALVSPAGRAQLDAWAERLSGELPELALPTDRARGPRGAGGGATLRFTIDTETTERLRALARQQEVSLVAVLLAAHAVLLSRFTGQREIVIGVPTNGRTSAASAQTVGYFVNTLPLRIELDADAPFTALLAHVRDRSVELIARQATPLAAIVERTARQGSPFQTTFTFQRVPSSFPATIAQVAAGHPATLDFGGARASATIVAERDAQFDTSLVLAEVASQLYGSFEYARDLFDASTAHVMVRAFEELLRSITAAPGMPVGRLSLLDDSARRELLTFGQRGDRGPQQAPLALIGELARTRHEALAVVEGNVRVTYGQLVVAFEREAERLRSFGVRAGSRVVLVTRRSVEGLVALLAIHRLGASWIALDPDLSEERRARLVADSGAHLIVEDGAEGLRYTAIAALARPDDDEAYVIYTSGSSGMPKGVVVTQAALTSFVTDAVAMYGLVPSDRVLQFAAWTFDVAIEEIFGTLSAGATLYLRGQDVPTPEALAELSTTLELTVLDLPTAYFHVLVDAVERGLVLPPSVRMVIFGGEAVHPGAVAAFRRHVRDELRLVNAYGPTEAVVAATSFECRPRDGSLRTPIGRPRPGMSARVVDARGELVPRGARGELWLAGELARGYLGRADLTAERFVADPFGERGERAYRTGDLVRWRGDGQLEYLGRLDDQIKLRGFRIELGEIEYALRAVPGVREAAATLWTSHGEKKIVAYVTGSAHEAALREALATSLPSYMMPAAFVSLAALPVTTSGKVDRRAFPEPRQDGAPYVAPRDEREVAIAAVWAEVLAVQQVGAHDDFFALGGHSLLATRVMSMLRTRLGVELPLRTIFEAPTVATFARRLVGAPATTTSRFVRLPRADRPPLSYAQERLWFLDQLDPGSSVAHMPAALVLEGELDVERLSRALREIIRRHEVLRTTFAAHEGVPYQIVHEASVLSLTAEEPSDLAACVRETFDATFDLTKGSPLRVRLLRRSAREHVLVVVMHHIVADGWSVSVLVRELASLYAGEALAPLLVQYADYATWQRSQDERITRELAYWQTTLTGAPELLELPTDYPRPAVRSSAGSAVTVRIPAELVSSLQILARAHDATLFMVLLSAWQVLLSAYSRQTDIVVGIPIANRTLAEVEPLIGSFVNTLALRTDLSGNPTFASLLARVRGTTLAAYEHQEVPFERVVESVNPQRSPSYAPLFQVMLVLQNAPEAAPNLEGLTVSAFTPPSSARGGGAAPVTAPFDIVLEITPVGEELVATWIYRTDLFEAPTLHSLTSSFDEILRAVVADDSLRVRSLALVNESKGERLLRAGNRDAEQITVEACIHEAFEAQVDRAPDAVALSFGDERLTYRELDERANALAANLLAEGARPDGCIGVCIERSVEMVVALLAVLKAGAGYVPIEPDYPAERISFTLEDAGAEILLTRGGLAARTAAHRGKTLLLDSLVAPGTPTRPVAGAVPSSTAYVIYTSGSTGRPKGVVVPHSNFMRLMAATARWFHFGPEDVWTVFHSYAFDFSVWELWGALTTGGRAVIVPHDVSRSPPEMWKLLDREGVTVLNQTPSSFRQLAAADPSTGTALRHVIFGGEPLEPSGLRPWTARRGLAAPQLTNMYGITETTVHVTYRRVDDEFLASTASYIGQPIPDLQLFVLDELLRPLPERFAGELYVGGAGLARGYLGRPALTAERFVPNPHGPPGSRLYRTGDLARQRGSDIEYLGRIDNQVKIRGFRIELGEVERVLAAQPDVEAAVVLVREDVPGDRRLVAYLITSRRDDTALREAAKRTLPAHMVPSAFVFLEQLPLTPNGKLDQRALPRPDHASLESGYVAPVTVEEQWLATVCARLLGVERVGRFDNFFELGGHSLLVTQLISQIRAERHVDVPLRVLFDAPTVAEMSVAILRCELEKAGDDAETSRMLDELESLSDDEVEALLGGGED